ncbi:DUF805 domain-containing protein [Thalassococcus sp. S3]|uniref:DUF805 domain-containing protein n=1 Tax=Thalassococcus sp. S3 TaxID=2017482 RepID=UPI0020C22E5A|nr:DUF805 domain-containing protein [Thalassococcus sp. S3]
MRKYVVFSGRATRPEYWYFLLFVILGNVITDQIDVTFGAASGSGYLSQIFSLLTLLPLLSAGWRRMHDSGRSGLHLLYPLIVMIGLTTFLGLLTGFEPMMLGDIGELIAGVGAVIALFSMLVFLISPLLVLWWLARPTEMRDNAYGPRPRM